MKPITTFGLAIALLAALTTAGPSLAAGNTPICMLLHPSGTTAVKINLNDTCGGINGTVTYRPKGKSQDRTLQLEGYGAGITVGQDSYCKINLHNDNNGVLIATLSLKLHVGKDGGQPAYTSVDYDLSFLNFKTMDDEQYKGSEKLMLCN